MGRPAAALPGGPAGHHSNRGVDLPGPGRHEPGPGPEPGPQPDPLPEPESAPQPDVESVAGPDPATESDGAPATAAGEAEAAAPNAAPALESTDVVTVLAPVAVEAQPPEPDSDSEDVAAPADREGLELLRELVLQRVPDEALVLHGGEVRALPEPQLNTLAQVLDQVREETTARSTVEGRLVASTATVASGLSIGYVVWLVRGGVLLSSLLSSIPAWRLVDPLPVLGRLDEEGDEDASGEEDKS